MRGCQGWEGGHGHCALWRFVLFYELSHKGGDGLLLVVEAS